MLSLAKAWAEGDVCLSKWNGTEAVQKYQQASQHAHLLDSIRPTEGYAGRPIRLDQETTSELEDSIARAKGEIGRYGQFQSLLKDSETELQERRAIRASNYFKKALKIAPKIAPNRY